MKTFLRLCFIISVCIGLSPSVIAQEELQAVENEPYEEERQTVENEPYEEELSPEIFTEEIPELTWEDESQDIEPLKVALILSDIYDKKDMEFVRGFILGIDRSELPSRSLSLKIINGGVPSDSLLRELAFFDPDLTVATHDKGIPPYLTAYTSENGKKQLNIFDSRSEDYLNTPGIFQVLPPSAVFNSKAAEKLAALCDGKSLLIVGEPDKSDSILKELLLLIPSSKVEQLTKDDVRDFKPETLSDYIVYPTSAAASEITEILQSMKSLAQDANVAGITVIGRPNWVAFNELNNLTDGWEVYIPTKCYFDVTAPESKKFIASYNSQFGHTPVRSFPVYAVMGYDAARYFLPLLVAEANGNHPEWKAETMLQSRFDMMVAGWNAGVYNKGGFLLHLNPGSPSERILIECED